MYGGSASTLYNTLSKEGAVDENGEPITKEKAQEYYDKYFEAYSGVANFIKEQKKFAHKHGCVYTILGRKRRLHNINGKDFREVAYEERLAVNSAIQGCLEENSAILTTKGYKAIKDLVPNEDELITTYGTTKNFNNYTTGEKQVYKLNTLHTEVYATMEHRFGVYDKGEIIFKKLSQLDVNDIIASKIGLISTRNSEAPKELILDTYNIVHNSKNYANLSKEQKSHVLRFKEGSGSLEACKKYLRLCEEKEAKELLKNLGDLTFSRITSIELVGLRKTMDIEIFTNDHSYIVGNLICHNSGGDIMMMCQPKIDADERLKELNCTMRLQVHDRHICRV